MIYIQYNLEIRNIQTLRNIFNSEIRYIPRLIDGNQHTKTYLEKIMSKDNKKRSYSITSYINKRLKYISSIVSIFDNDPENIIYKIREISIDNIKIERAKVYISILTEYKLKPTEKTKIAELTNYEKNKYSCIDLNIKNYIQNKITYFKELLNIVDKEEELQLYSDLLYNCEEILYDLNNIEVKSIKEASV